MRVRGFLSAIASAILVFGSPLFAQTGGKETKVMIRAIARDAKIIGTRGEREDHRSRCRHGRNSRAGNAARQDRRYGRHNEETAHTRNGYCSVPRTPGYLAVLHLE